jgi:hypothetical protein
MFRQINFILFVIGLITYDVSGQEDGIRFFDLETKPTISILYDETYKRERNSISTPTNIYSPTYQRRTINIAEQVERKEFETRYLAQIYQSRIDQQQSRISENYKASLKTNSRSKTEAQFRNPYNNQAYGWQNDFYNSSRLWRPTFYQGTRFGSLNANRFVFY